ncbi:MAG: MarR family transcriptional regulator [Oscillospiraceae bacterium]|nr:MarR family transcriptional regulator [Oscillospiraceae bacterium]MBQ3049860.1 MarR family transcriptional regulator [Oscillospiraceae bacterium]MBQ9939259.1 MarR family transcriptional regulator [Oscillospiraceae bacterium]
MYELNAGFDVWSMLRNLNDFFDDLIKPVAQKHGLTVMQLRLLCAVKNLENATVGSVAENAGIAAANASAMCKKLSELGYLLRRKNETDDRVVCLELTNNGDMAASEADEKINETYQNRELQSFWKKLSEEMSANISKHAAKKAKKPARKVLR